MIDNYDLFVADDRARQKWLKTRPLCEDCGLPIQEDYKYSDCDGATLCEECAERWLRSKRRYIW